MKILITGAKGFIGRNVVLRLKNSGYENIVEFDVDSPKEILADAVKDCGFVLHFAGVNRPKDDGEFMSGNFGFTTELLQMLEAAKNKSPILITSSIQAALDN
ncbi:MAG: NAD-dependent epimerase/dehydratase family protein, partial [Opitutales bacterium]|nr:NAD-dependent epimerase/dehydratase family protein [Opitutales bacterium]